VEIETGNGKWKCSKLDANDYEDHLCAKAT